MPDYDFHTLNDRDFELLIRDVLNEQEKERMSNIVYRTFPPGRDQGIDLLDSSSAPGKYNIIVQVKHYVKSSFAKLLNRLLHSTPEKTAEIDKLRLLNPNGYFLVTSQELTRQNKELICEKMAPYLSSPNHVIDRVELNRLLHQYPAIEASHFKLWFSSRSVFERILHN